LGRCEYVCTNVEKHLKHAVFLARARLGLIHVNGSGEVDNLESGVKPSDMEVLARLPEPEAKVVRRFAIGRSISIVTGPPAMATSHPHAAAPFDIPTS
jgi:hypothetical protein